MTGTVLELNGVTKSFGGVHAIKGLSFSVNQNEIVGLIGPNGSGKTTTVNVLSGASPMTSGDILLRARAKITSHFRRRCILLGGVVKVRNMLDIPALSRLANQAPRHLKSVN